ncbi:MAG: sel1 repeat family protein [Magnetococcales bacterium]|nr:sel1 repeat family protein [Magnetococcales bacterium]
MMMHVTGLLIIALVVLVMVPSVGYSLESRSVDEIRKAAEQGSVNDQMKLGKMYSTGDGVPQDCKESERWYLKAHSYFHLGSLYFTGTGCRQDDKEAVKWYHKAAEHGVGFPRRIPSRLRQALG